MRTTRPGRLGLFGALIVLVAVAAAAGVASAASPSAHARALVKLRSTSLGKVLVDASGLTLYMYLPDKHGRSACYGQCAAFWPPLLTAGKPAAGTGVKTALLGTTKRKDGKLQVTYAGHPLYRFAQDKKAGQTNGEGFQSIWFVVSAKGTKVEKAASAAPPATTTPTTTTGGYGYAYPGG